MDFTKFAAFFDELQKIAGPPPIPLAALKGGSAGARQAMGGLTSHGRGVLSAVPLKGSPMPPLSGGAAKGVMASSPPPLPNMAGFKSLAGGGPIMPGGQLVKGSSMEKEEGIGSWFSGKALGAGVSKVAPKMISGGAGGASALRAAEASMGKGVTTGVVNKGYVGGVARGPAKPIGSLQQNIAERGIDL